MRATVTWDGHHWVAVPEVGGTTFARRLDQLPARVAEVVELMTGSPVDPDEIGLDVDFDGAFDAVTLRGRRVQLDAEERELVESTRRVVRQLRAGGMSLRDAAFLTGLSYQRIDQLAKQDVG